MENLTALETATLFGVSREAIRKYCLEFRTYLSPVASPQSGRQRMLTPDDLEVISLIVTLKAEGKLFADIHAALGAGQRGGVPMVPLAISPAPGNTLALQNRISELESQLDHERAQRHKAEGQVELLEKQLERLQERLFKREW